EEYGGADDFAPLDFFHPIDEFMEPNTWIRSDTLYPETVAPLVGKGVEILKDDINNKTIHQAMSQLSYSFADKVTSAIVHQIDKLMVHEMAFCHIPMIVTTANLLRLNTNLRISDVQDANELNEIAS
ncbi:unnamed protein product, partial [marine sediment metagenome]